MEDVKGQVSDKLRERGFNIVEIRQHMYHIGIRDKYPIRVWALTTRNVECITNVIAQKADESGANDIFVNLRPPLIIPTPSEIRFDCGCAAVNSVNYMCVVEAIFCNY